MSSIPIIIKMTIIELLKKVLVSWQVIAVTLAIIIYFFIVSYTARTYHRPRSSKKPKVKAPKKKKADAAAADSEGAGSGGSDELGIEEA